MSTPNYPPLDSDGRQSIGGGDAMALRRPVFTVLCVVVAAGAIAITVWLVKLAWQEHETVARLDGLIPNRNRAEANDFDYSSGTPSISAQDVRAATAYINRSPDYTAFKLLMLLRRDHPAAYAAISARLRANVLCDTLARIPVTNQFGLMQGDWYVLGPAGEAVVEAHKDAIEPLRRILEDKRPAPCEGSKEATLSAEYRYRRADYAYVFIGILLGRNIHFSINPTERDDDMEWMKANAR